MPPWKRSAIYSGSFVIAFFLSVAIDLACGPEPDPYDYYTSFFRNSIVQPDHDYRSFYFNGMQLLNDPDEQVSEADINVKEWAGYLKDDQVTRKDINKVLYHLDHNTDSIYFQNKKATSYHIPDSLRQNTFLNALAKDKYAAARAYFETVKRNEPLVNVPFERWDPQPRDTPAIAHAADIYLQKATDPQNDAFLKLRYYYQAQRALHYSAQFKKAGDVFDKYIKNDRSDSHVKGWAMALKAGELYHQDDPVHSAYLFAQVFGQYPERRVQAYHNYVDNEADIKAVIKLAKNDDERADIYAINGFHTSQLDLAPLRSVYGIQPRSPLVRVLLLREVNKIEEGYLNPKLNQSNYYGSWWSSVAEKKDSTRNVYLTYIGKLNTFCKQLTAERKMPEPALATLTSAYLSWIKEDNLGGMAALNTLNNEKLNTRLENQRQMIRLLLLVQKTKKLEAVSEVELLPSLQWLGQKVAQEAKATKKGAIDDWYYGKYRDASDYANMARDFYSLILAPVYLKQKDTCMAALAMLKSQYSGGMGRDEAADPSSGEVMPDLWQRGLHSYHLQQLLSWSAKPDRTPYLKLMMSNINPRSLSSIYDLLGTAYLREHNYPAAVAAFTRIPKKKMKKGVYDAWNEDDRPRYSDPFISQVRDYPKRFLLDSTKGYDKLMFAKAMAGLQAQIKADPKNAAAYFKLATGLYNTSTYGNSWQFISYSWSSYDYEKGNVDYYDRDFTQALGAQSYYLKARSVSNDPEFKARCTFMIAKCAQKQIKYPPADYDNYKGWQQQEKTYQQKVKRNLYFAELGRDYKNTRFLRTAVAECSYLRDFLYPKTNPKTAKGE